jgi:hypothetical protein
MLIDAPWMSGQNHVRQYQLSVRPLVRSLRARDADAERSRRIGL